MNKPCLLFIALGLAVYISSLGASERAVTIGMISDLRSPDPVFSVSDFTDTIHNGLFEQLVQFDSGEIKPGQADSWTISEDGTVYRFRLGDDITWSDGEPVTAHDFALSLQRLMQPAEPGRRKSAHLVQIIRGYNAYRNGEVDFDKVGVAVLDERTLQITLKAPTPHFLLLLAWPALSPTPSHLVQNGLDDWLDADQLVSNGPYLLTDWATDYQAQGDDVILDANPNYAGTAVTNVEQVRIRAYDRRSDLLRGIVSAELDMIGSGLEGDEVQWLRGRDDFSRFNIEPFANFHGSIYASLNVLNPKLADPKLRRAILMALDRKYIARRIGADVAPALTFAAPGLVELRAEDRPQWLGWSMSRRRSEARSLIRAVRGADAEPLQIDLVYSGRGMSQRNAYLLRSMLSEVGVDIRIRDLEMKPFINLVLSGSYEMFIGHWIADYADAANFHGLLATGNDRNYGGWSNPQYDALLQAGITSHKPQARLTIASQLEAILLQEAPVMSLSHPIEYFAFNDRIAAYGNTAGYTSLRTLWLAQ